MESTNIVNRRLFLKNATVLALAIGPLSLDVFGQQNLQDFVFRLLPGGDPASHCNQNHDHYACPFPGGFWASGNYLEYLNWSSDDGGYNEGADAAIQILNQASIQVPGPFANLAGGLAGNLWKRWQMMNFARALTRNGNYGAGVAIGIVSQWHNCHCYRCLTYHVLDVGQFLLQSPYR